MVKKTIAFVLILTAGASGLQASAVAQVDSPGIIRTAFNITKQGVGCLTTAASMSVDACRNLTGNQKMVLAFIAGGITIPAVYHNYIDFLNTQTTRWQEVATRLAKAKSDKDAQAINKLIADRSFQELVNSCRTFYFLSSRYVANAVEQFRVDQDVAALKAKLSNTHFPFWKLDFWTRLV